MPVCISMFCCRIYRSLVFYASQLHKKTQKCVHTCEYRMKCALLLPLPVRERNSSSVRIRICLLLLLLGNYVVHRCFLSCTSSLDTADARKLRTRAWVQLRLPLAQSEVRVIDANGTHTQSLKIKFISFVLSGRGFVPVNYWCLRCIAKRLNVFIFVFLFSF